MDVSERSFQRLQRWRATAGLGGEELEGGKSKLQSPQDITGGGHSGQDRKVSRLRGLDDGGGQARRHDELRACVRCELQLRRGIDGSCADDGVRRCGLHCRDGWKSRRSPERDLEHLQAAVAERTGEGACVLQPVDDQDRNDRGDPHDLGNGSHGTFL